jgi:hypothetical protein
MNAAAEIVIEAGDPGWNYWPNLFRYVSYFVLPRGVMSSFAASKPWSEFHARLKAICNVS